MTRRRGPRTAHGARAPSITWRRGRRRGPGRPKGAGAAKIPWDARGFRARELSGGEFTVSPPGAWKTPWDAKGFSGKTALRRFAAARASRNGRDVHPNPGPPSRVPRHARGETPPSAPPRPGRERGRRRARREKPLRAKGFQGGENPGWGIYRPDRRRLENPLPRKGFF